MWRNPKYATEPDEAEPSTSRPPEPTGRTLAALARSTRGGAVEELRVSLDSYQGHPFVSVRVWREDASGGWWPVKGKGTSVRIAELASVADALRAAARIVEDARIAAAEKMSQEADRPRTMAEPPRQPRGMIPRPSRETPLLPPVDPRSEGFDEFDGG